MTEKEFKDHMVMVQRKHPSCKLKGFSYEDLLLLREQLVRMLTEPERWSLPMIRSKLGLYQSVRADVIMAMLMRFNDVKLHYNRVFTENKYHLKRTDL